MMILTTIFNCSLRALQRHPLTLHNKFSIHPQTRKRLYLVSFSSLNMGQNQSHPGPAARHDEIDGKSSSSSRPSYKPPGSSLFEFALLWLGGKIHPAAVSLPSCWDEFLDWAEDATNITAVLRINNLCNVETTSNSIADDRIRETDASPTFTPLALNGDCEILENLPSMTWMERASLYSESVSLIRCSFRPQPHSARECQYRTWLIFPFL